MFFFPQTWEHGREFRQPFHAKNSPQWTLMCHLIHHPCSECLCIMYPDNCIVIYTFDLITRIDSYSHVSIPINNILWIRSLLFCSVKTPSGSHCVNPFQQQFHTNSSRCKKPRATIPSLEINQQGDWDNSI